MSELLVVAVLFPIGFDISVSATVQGSVYLVLIWLSFVDWQSYHVPLPMVIFLALLLASLYGTAVIAAFVINGAVCLLLWLSANSAIGSGDICLLLALGWGVRPLQFIWLIGLAAALGLVWTILKRQRQPIPFVPFISMSYFFMTGGVFDGGFVS